MSILTAFYSKNRIESWSSYESIDGREGPLSCENQKVYSARR